MNRYFKNLIGTKTIRKRKPARVRLALDNLETRVVPADQLTATLDLSDRVLRIEGTEGADTIQVRHQGGQVSIDGITIQVVDVDVVGDFASVSDHDVAAIDIRALAGNDAIFVEDQADGTALSIDAGLGLDVSWVTEASAWAPVSYDGGTGIPDYLYVNDFRPGAHAYTITDSAVTGTGISLPYMNLTTLVLFSGNDAADTFDVQSTRAGSEVHLWGYGGDDTYRVGGPVGLDAVRGNVFVWGMNGTDSLTIDNAGGSPGRFEVSSTQFTMPSGTFVDYNQAVEAISLRGGANDETFALLNTSAAPPMTIDGGGGANTLEYAIQAGLAAWYPGEYTAADNVGDRHGTLVNGVTFAEGRVGQAFQFSGFEDPGYVQVPNAPELEPTTVSVEAWVNSTHLNEYGAYSYIVSKGAAEFRGASYALVTSINGGLWFYIGNGSAFAYSPDPGTGIWDGNWHHVVGTYDGTFVRLFVDGVEVGNGSPLDFSLGYGLPTTNDLFIGTYNGIPGYTFNGRIDEVSVYDRALTAAQVQNLFANGKASAWDDGVIVDLSTGTATGLSGIANIRNVIGASGNDTLTGDVADNYLSGRAGSDTLIGKKGADVLDGGSDSDYMVGGLGRNTYIFDSAPYIEVDTVLETSAVSLGTLDFSRLTANEPVDVDLTSNSVLAVHLHRFVSNAAGGTPLGYINVVGGAGNDVVLGNGRNNLLMGGTGADNLDGGTGKDTLAGGDGNDTMDGAAGHDTAQGDGGNDLLKGNNGDDSMDGGLGDDRLEGQQGEDWLFGSEGNDSVIGGENADYLSGDAGNDYLEGNFGRDYYLGGSGNDYCYEYGDTRDTFFGGDGNDYLFEAATSNGNDIMYGGAGNDRLDGSLDNDLLVGDDGHDTLVGAENDDTLRGENGNDKLWGGATGDSVTNQSDNDVLEGGYGDDYLNGGNNLDIGLNGVYRDSLYGNEGDDIIVAGKGRELLVGGPGNDSMYGDDGRDTMNAGDGWDDLVYPGRGNDDVFADSFDRVVDIVEIHTISPVVGDAPQALQAGTLVTITGTALPANAQIQFGGSYFQYSPSALGTDVWVSPDRTTITARVPRGAMSGSVYLIGIVGTLDDPVDGVTDDDVWMSAPQQFEVRTFTNTYGFSFRNFKFNVSVPLVQDSFGTDQTNIIIPPGIVTPVPTPETLAFTAIAALVFNDKGACFGMAQMSQHLAHHPEWFNSGIGLPPNSAPTVFNLTPDGNLLNFIERFHLHQLSQEAIEHTIGWNLGSHTKQSIKDQIRDLLLAGDRPLLSFQDAIAKGHVVVAYDLEDATDTPEADDYYIHTYDPNRPFGSTFYSDIQQLVPDTPNVNGQKIAGSRVYIGSNNQESGDEWRFMMAGGEVWAGGFGSLMVIPYGTVPTDPTFPGSLPSLADLILGTEVAGGQTGGAGRGLVSAEGLSPKSALQFVPAMPATLRPEMQKDRYAVTARTNPTAAADRIGEFLRLSVPSWEVVTDLIEPKLSVGKGNRGGGI